MPALPNVGTPSDKTRTEFDIRQKDGKRVRRGTWALTYRLDDELFKVIDPITEVDLSLIHI